MESMSETIKKTKQYQGADSYMRYGLVVQVFNSLSETQEIECEYRPQYSKRAFPEMSSNAPFGIWIHRKELWPIAIKGDESRICEPLEDKYSNRSNDLELIKRWNDSFDSD